MNFKILSFELNATEKKGFQIKRPSGKGHYVFARFHTPTIIQDRFGTEMRRPNACILFGPNTDQLFSSPENDLLHDYVTFKVANGLFFQQIGFKTDTVFYPSSCELLDSTREEIQSERAFSFIAKQEMINSALTLLFITLARDMYYTETGSGEAPLHESFFQLRNDMFLNPGEYTVKDMAEKLHLTPAYFSARYRQLFKISPMRDLTNAKVEMAKKLLGDGRHPQTVSELMNFDSLPNFYKWFKKNTGMTPKEFLQVPAP